MEFHFSVCGLLETRGILGAEKPCDSASSAAFVQLPELIRRHVSRTQVPSLFRAGRCSRCSEDQDKRTWSCRFIIHAQDNEGSSFHMQMFPCLKLSCHSDFTWKHVISAQEPNFPAGTKQKTQSLKQAAAVSSDCDAETWTLKLRETCGLFMLFPTCWWLSSFSLMSPEWACGCCSFTSFRGFGLGWEWKCLKVWWDFSRSSRLPATAHTAGTWSSPVWCRNLCFSYSVTTKLRWVWLNLMKQPSDVSSNLDIKICSSTSGPPGGAHPLNSELLLSSSQWSCWDVVSTLFTFHKHVSPFIKW